jgi:hypothetical protein
MPKNDTVNVFNGINQYFTVDDNDYLEIFRTVILTINTVNVNSTYPTGCVNIFKNGIERDLDSLLGYRVILQNGTASMRIGTQQLQSFVKGAIGKVAVFDYELNSSQVQIHFNCMITNTNCSGLGLSLNTTCVTSGFIKPSCKISVIWLWIIGTLSTRICSG